MYYFVKQQRGENIYFLFERHRVQLFVKLEAVLCAMFVLLFCNSFIPFVTLYGCINVLLVSVITYVIL